jgi:hypothetical protein
LPKKDKARKCVTITVNLTETEKNAVDEYAAARGFDTATIVRRLIQVLFSGKLTFPELLQRCMEAPVVNEFANEPAELRIHRISVRLSQKEKGKLAVLTAGAFYRPGEFVRILLRLLAIGIIKPGEIWE